MMEQKTIKKQKTIKMKMLKLIGSVLLVLVYCGSSGQKYIAENGYIRFFSEAPLEDIEAVNQEGRSVFEPETGNIAFIIPIRDFIFEKDLMQQHFNEKYLESDKYPRATFSGKIEKFRDIAGKQDLTATGELTIHGISREVEVEGTGTKSGDKILLEASFPVGLEDYEIDIPRVVMFNIAEVVDVTIKFEYQSYESE